MAEPLQSRRPLSSLRYKVIAVLGLVLVGAMGSYLYLATSLFNADKLAYVYDLNATLAQTKSEEVAAALGGISDRLRLWARLSGGSKDGARAARDALFSDADILAAELYGGPSSERLAAVVNEDELRRTQLPIEDLERAGARVPARLDEVRSERLLLENISLPPELALLRLSVVVDQGVVLATVRPDRLLRIFGASSVYRAYLIDLDGVVLAHPDPEAVLSKRSLRSPLVEEAFVSRASRGTRAYRSVDEQEMLGAFAEVERSNLLVITEVPRAEALRASAELIRQSALFAAVVLLAAFLLGIHFSRRLTAPIRSLEAATRQVASGDFETRVEVQGGDEVASLASAFNHMGEELRVREKQLAESQSALVQQEKLATLGEMTAALAHEVKNPLTGIRGFAQLGKMKSDPDELKKLFAMIEESTTRVQEILNSHLAYTRHESKMDEVSIHELARGVEQLLAFQLRRANVTLELDVPESLPTVKGNPSQLQQVLVNLMVNAQHAMDGGGVLTVRARDENSSLVIEVSDTGEGIEEGIRETIFEPFFTTKERGKGTGLGLSVTSTIVKRHHGNIEVDSTVGVGTTFRITLPLKAAASRTPAAASGAVALVKVNRAR